MAAGQGQAKAQSKASGDGSSSGAVPSAGLGPRKAALRLVGGVLSEGKLLPEMAHEPFFAALPPDGRARAQRLALQVLRSMSRADKLLEPHLSRKPPLAVRNVLRLGVVELMDGEAAHGVVNDLVTIIAKGKRTQNYKGLVNAVLRKMAGQEDLAQAWAKLTVPRLPNWLRQPLVHAWGRPAIVAAEAAHFVGAALDITPRGGNGEALAERLKGRLLPTGTIRLDGARQVSALTGFEAGEWWVQDAAAALPARILNAQAGETVLDLCAAPGGKTMQMVAAGATVTAVDSSATRLERLEENLWRTRLKAEVICADALTFEGGPYDAILLDAPCSATGTVRRHADLPHAKDGSGFFELIALQTQMLDHALSLLKPGGRLIYCACSLLPDEGEVQVEEALARHDGLVADKTALEVPGVAPEWHTSEGGLRLLPGYWPDQGGMDGFYIACLRKPA
ncbi:MAG: methyltransferase domain-containing protein [Rhodobacteraceae bacterium]|nr:methyltransferase domain-containing protein [Paracoccaceae bacterium]